MKDISGELKAWGHLGGEGHRLILKSDGECPFRASKEAVRKYHGGIVMMEVSDRGESQSNGKCEQAVQVVAEFLRVLKGSSSSGARSRLCAVTLSHIGKVGSIVVVQV